ncbi:hypothetical protein BH18ACT5_BH18ACT5_05910 [soil metagenome]
MADRTWVLERRLTVQGLGASAVCNPKNSSRRSTPSAFAPDTPRSRRRQPSSIREVLSAPTSCDPLGTSSPLSNRRDQINIRLDVVPTYRARAESVARRLGAYLGKPLTIS